MFRQIIKATLPLTLLALGGIFVSASMNSIGEIRYIIDDASYLTIEGSSNVTGFECKCTQDFTPSSLETEVFENGKKALFRGGNLTIRTKSFDCGQKGISKDMHKALKADNHPYISIEVLEVIQKKQFFRTSNQEWIPMTAKANLTIAKCTQTLDLQIKGIQVDSGRYRFVCSENVNMTSFNIDPPKPLMGLIKVDDQITIHLDLIVNLLEV